MELPLEISYRDVEPSDTLQELIDAKVQKLDERCQELISCRVSVEAPHRSKESAPRFYVRIELKVPSREFVVSNDQHDSDRALDLYATVRDAFSKAERQLRDYTQRRSRHVKQHEAPATGVIVRLIEDQKKGYIRALDGREFYFEEDCLLDGNYDSLKVNDRVSFAQPSDDRPLQARSVVLAEFAAPGAEQL